MEKTNAELFATLNTIDVSEHIEKKGNLSYLSWAWAWQIFKGQCPDATCKVYENADGWNYHTDGRTCWVKTGVTANGIEYIEYLPIMDNNNRSIPLERVTSWDVNKAIQRSLTKAIARHGLAMYLYAGEDLPDTPEEKKPAKETKKAATTAQKPASVQTTKPQQKPAQNAEKPKTTGPVAEISAEDISVAYALLNSNPQIYENCVTKFMLAGELKGTAADFSEAQMREITIALKAKHII